MHMEQPSCEKLACIVQDVHSNQPGIECQDIISIKVSFRFNEVSNMHFSL